jgi:hypothetical protein
VQKYTALGQTQWKKGKPRLIGTSVNVLYLLYNVNSDMYFSVPIECRRSIDILQPSDSTDQLTANPYGICEGGVTNLKNRLKLNLFLLMLFKYLSTNFSSPFLFVL